jgi:hypothetical protein
MKTVPIPAVPLHGTPSPYDNKYSTDQQQQISSHNRNSSNMIMSDQEGEDTLDGVEEIA